jgi:hypothetical protein
MPEPFLLYSREERPEGTTERKPIGKMGKSTHSAPFPGLSTRLLTLLSPGYRAAGEAMYHRRTMRDHSASSSAYMVS